MSLLTYRAEQTALEKESIASEIKKMALPNKT